MTEPHPPRKHDHLVEPMYAGLGINDRGEPSRSPLRWILWSSIVLAAVLWLLSLS